jgi:hypothetical protein
MERNSKLRALRESRPSSTFPGDPMSRAELAEAVNAELWRATGRHYAIDAHTIARYERGAVRWPNAAYRSALRTILDATDEQLGFRPTPRGASVIPVKPDTTPDRFDEGSETAHVDRREFVRAAGLAAIAGGAARRRDPLYFITALSELQAADTAHGPEEPIVGATQLLRELAAELRAAQGSDRAALLRTGARTAEFAGFLYRDLGRPDRSLFWHDRAMDLAQENQDHAMQAYVLLRKAQAAYDQRDAARMLGLARSARGVDGAISAGLRAEINQQEARGEAMLGLPDRGVQQKLDKARSLLAESCPLDDDAPGAGTTPRSSTSRPPCASRKPDAPAMPSSPIAPSLTVTPRRRATMPTSRR